MMSFKGTTVLALALLATFPSEKNLFAVAGAWSVDPSTLETRHLPPSLGLVGSGSL